jgi:hypothetical protein
MRKGDRNRLLQLLIAMPWKTDANGYAIIKRSHAIVFLTQGKIVARDETVHHKNEIKSDDSPDNLEVMTRAAHMRLHYKPVSHEIRKASWTAERKQKMSARMKGNKLSALVHRREGWTGERPAEYRAKASERMKRIWAERRARKAQEQTALTVH